VLSTSEAQSSFDRLLARSPSCDVVAPALLFLDLFLENGARMGQGFMRVAGASLLSRGGRGLIGAEGI
jgi:hypothetical protein